MTSPPKTRSDGYLRETMPKVTEFIDGMRAAFGKAAVDAWVRDGRAAGTFYASEDGHTIGQPPEPPKNAVSLRDVVLNLPEPEPEVQPRMRYR